MKLKIMKYPQVSPALCLLFVICCNPLQAVQNDTVDRPAAHPKYIFLFIGDGMAGAQIHAAEAYLGSIAEKEAVKDDIRVETLTMSRFPVSGMQMSYAKNRFITGSAAAATALACGIKTDINIIAMHPDTVTPCRTVAEMAKSKGMKVGIVSSVSLDHATPAAFYAHVPNRMQYREIAQRLIGSGFNYFAGGGFMATPDIEENAFESGYIYVQSRAGFDSLEAGERNIIAVNPWLDRNSAMPYALNR
ncbi:MAG: alkaline phosphatase, partial [Acidobacteriota bacterium]